MKVKSILPACAIVILLNLAAATSMFKLDLEDLSVSAEKVVQAEVTDIVTQWDKEGKMLFTYIRMNILDDFIGEDEDNEIIIKMVGGQDGTNILDVDGNPVYTVGEENVLFLFNEPSNYTISQTLGMYQGKYRIFRDESGVLRVVQEPKDKNVTLLKRKMKSGSSGNNLTLEEFKQTVLMHRQSSGK